MKQNSSRVVFLQGNEACAEGAFKAGAKFYAGYPITPSSEIAEIASRKLPAMDGVFIQMEDELSSMGAIIGASLTGKKSFTATSGPGFSLMQENLGVAIMAEVPCVIINVQRSGPSTGLATKPAQADVMQARWGTHGDHAIIALYPTTVQECYDLTIQAFNFAEKYRTPVVLLSDEIVGHMREKVMLHDEINIIDRKSPSCSPNDFRPYEFTTDKVPPMASYGSEYVFHTNGSMHDTTGYPTSNPIIAEKIIKRLYDKIYDNADDIIITKQYETNDAEILLIAYGATARTAREVVEIYRTKGKKIGLLQINTIWPFPEKVVLSCLSKAKSVIVPEMNLGQIINEVRRVVPSEIPVVGYQKSNGQIITPNEIIKKIEEVL